MILPRILKCRRATIRHHTDFRSSLFAFAFGGSFFLHPVLYQVRPRGEHTFLWSIPAGKCLSGLSIGQRHGCAVRREFKCGITLSSSSSKDLRRWQLIAMMADLFQLGNLVSVLVLLSFQVAILCLSAVPLSAVHSVTEDAFSSRRHGQDHATSGRADIGPFSGRSGESARQGGIAGMTFTFTEGKSNRIVPESVVTAKSGSFRHNYDVYVAEPWPEEFTINFTTKRGTVSGLLAYDWAEKRQIIYHGAQSTYCTNFGTQDACQMFEYPAGTYNYIPSLGECTLTNEGVGTVSPDWTTNSVYIGIEEVTGVGLCRGFAFPPSDHLWYETLKGGLPCKFVFPSPDMSFYFDPDSLVLGKPDETYFDLPDACLNNEKLQTRRNVM